MRYADQTIYLDREITRNNVREHYHALQRLKGSPVVRIDVSATEEIDSAGAAFVAYLQSRLGRDGQAVGTEPELVHVKPHVARSLELFSPSGPLEKTPAPRDGWLLRLGDKVYQQGSNIGSFLRLSAVITVWSLPSLFERSAFRKGAIARQCINIGASATTIVSVLSVVIGLIVVLQAATSLAQFGADVFVVDLLGITVTREMGPLITAIIIAGRSGSAIAAQIATMKVTEELDALRVMALEPVRYVMVPMLFGMLISIPLLTALSILVGIGGGMIVGALSLDFTLVTVIDRLASVLGPIDLFIGIGKSFFFGAAIVFVACHFGVTAVGGSEGVGHATTRSVVVSIFSVIVLDALFSLLYLT